MSECFPLVSVRILLDNLPCHLLMSPLGPWSAVLSGLDFFLLPTRLSSVTTLKRDPTGYSARWHLLRI